jgi:hypothetical protein
MCTIRKSTKELTMNKVIATLIAGLFASAAFAQTPAPTAAAGVGAKIEAKQDKAVAKAEAKDDKTAVKAEAKESKQVAKAEAKEAKADVKFAKADAKESKADVKVAKAGTKHKVKANHKAEKKAEVMTEAKVDAAPAK